MVSEERIKLQSQISTFSRSSPGANWGLEWFMDSRGARGLVTGDLKAELFSFTDRNRKHPKLSVKMFKKPN